MRSVSSSDAAHPLYVADLFTIQILYVFRGGFSKVEVSLDYIRSNLIFQPGHGLCLV